MTGALTTEDVKDLLATLEQSQANLRAAERRLRAHGDAIALEARPTYPTAGQVAGIEEAARRIRAGVQPGSHHGDPAGPEGEPYVVVVDGIRGWLNVRVGAPYRLARQGERLWDFTDEEVEAVLAVVRAQGFVVTSHWRADNSLSITVRDREEA